MHVGVLSRAVSLMELCVSLGACRCQPRHCAILRATCTIMDTYCLSIQERVRRRDLSPRLTGVAAVRFREFERLDSEHARDLHARSSIVNPLRRPFISTMEWLSTGVARSEIRRLVTRRSAAVERFKCWADFFIVLRVSGRSSFML